MTTQEILNKAADRVEQGWTQKAWARDARGDGVSANSKSAVCWCMYGAIRAAAPDNPYGVARGAGALVGSLGLGPGLMTEIADWNDAPGRTQVEVVAALRQAAQAA